MNNGKIRIYELSKELNLENRDILAACEKLGIAVKSHSSTISGEEAEKIRLQAPKISANRSSNRNSDRKTSKSPVKSKPKAKPAVKQQQILEIRRSEPPVPPVERPPSDEQIQPPSPPEPATPNSPQRPERPAGGAGNEPSASSPGESRAQQSSGAANTLSRPVSPAAPVRPSSTRPSPKVEAPARPVSPTRPAPPNKPTPPSSKGKPAPAPKLSQPSAPTPPAPKAPASPNRAAAQPSSPAESRQAAAPRPSTPRPRPSLASPPSRPSRSSSAPAREGGRDGSAPSTPRPRPKPPQVSRPSAQGERSSGERPSSERPRPARPVVNSKRPVKGKRDSRSEGGGGAPRSAPPQIVQLKRPELAKPPTRPAAATSAEVEGEDFEDAAAPPARLPELERPRRPAPPSRPSRRGAPTRAREEFEDGENRKKTANRPKKKIHIIGDDDDDLLGAAVSGGGEMSAAISMSLARPPKPKGMQSSSPATKPASSPARRRPSKNRGGSRRDNNQQNRVEKPQRPEIISIKRGGMSVQELASVLVTPETDIIRILFFKGIAATITQTLEDETIELICQELDVLVDFEQDKAISAGGGREFELSEGDEHSRPPVVTIMGHVDHGKTTLLDSIRETKVAAGEAGGITQHIGAYHVDVEHNGAQQQIVFLDTPGHEAFTAMRARGTRVTDIAILVVAADDGVRPQTLEAISHAKAAKVPLIVAINKIDKEGAQPDRVKQELTEQGLVPEEWGGDTMMVPVSALNGDNLDQLLENILLVSEIEELVADPNSPAKGTVIEANLDKARGPVATLLIQNGTLKVGDALVAGSVFGRVRAMIDDRGESVESAGPSFAVEVLGLSRVPGAGDEFDVFLDEKEARSVADDRAIEQRNDRLRSTTGSTVSLGTLSARAQEGSLKELNLILKSDVQGSLEAIAKSLDQLPQDEVQINVLLSSPGEITETDVDLAAASGAVILGFSTTLASGAKRAADEAGVDVREYDIIYKLLEDVQGAMEGLLEPEMVEEPLGQVEVRAVFAVGRNAVAGCYVQSGKATRNCKIRVHRGSQTVFAGDLDSLRRVREDVKEVNAGYECGIGVDRFNDWQEGDVIETFRMVSKRRTLNV